MTATRRGDWIQTFSGGQFWPLDPRPSEIFLLDIAAGLAKECRYGGQCLRFYTVAEHSCLMDREAKRLGYSVRERRAVLFHDASEGMGLRDIPRPIKGELTNYREIEDRIMRTVAKRFDFDWPMPKHLKLLDEQIGLTEESQNMADKPAAWRTQQHKFEATQGIATRLECWLPDRAFVEFMHAASQLGIIA